MTMKIFALPAMGEGVFEAKINKWLKSEGDLVKAEEPLLEVSTDKVNTEIVAPFSGKLMHLLANAGEMVAVGAEIAQIATDSTTVPVNDSKSATTAPPTPSSKATGKKPLASPLVRKLAAEHGINLQDLPQTKRLTKRDIDAYLAARTAATTAPTQQSTPPTTSRLATKYIDGEEYLDGVKVRREKMSAIRQAIANHMLASVRTSPHVTTVFEIDMEQLLAAKNQFAPVCQQKYGFKLTCTPYFLHVACTCLQQFPSLNASVDGDDVLWKDSINIGCAVSLGADGLIVPVLRNADTLSLEGIARKLNDLVLKARAKQLAAEDVCGGTFSITNPGVYGSLMSNPIINQPQVAILGIGRIVPRAVVVDGMIAIRHQALISLTFDHRLVDGEAGARFLALFKERAENYHRQ
ncbi:MAG: dihydrolipoamide acetyltransferase family protein [Pseudomonadota bacterium]|nr:dihydrolipoamide acetyltransferase family protein [Pseudomonadota bacterium]